MWTATHFKGTCELSVALYVRGAHLESGEKSWLDQFTQNHKAVPGERFYALQSQCWQVSKIAALCKPRATKMGKSHGKSSSVPDPDLPPPGPWSPPQEPQPGS